MVHIIVLVAGSGLRMELDLGAGGDSTRRKVEGTGEAMEITPLEMYDSARAKIAANLRWIFAKAYGIGKLFLSSPRPTIFILVQIG